MDSISILREELNISPKTSTKLERKGDGLAKVTELQLEWSLWIVYWTELLRALYRCQIGIFLDIFLLILSRRILNPIPCLPLHRNIGPLDLAQSELWRLPTCWLGDYQLNLSFCDFIAWFWFVAWHVDLVQVWAPFCLFLHCSLLLAFYSSFIIILHPKHRIFIINRHSMLFWTCVRTVSFSSLVYYSSLPSFSI